MYDFSNKYQTNSDPFLLGIIPEKTFISKKCPNSPLMKGPYLRVKVECKNLEVLLNSKNRENKEIKFFSPNKNNYIKEPELDINAFVKINLNEQLHILPVITHNNPKWLNYYELEIKNYKVDKVFFEIFNQEKQNIFLNSNNGLIEEFLGFQVLPLKYLEKHNLVGSENQILLRLIDKNPSDYFVDDEKHVLNLENHDPTNYKLDESIINDNNDSKLFL